MPKKHKQSTHIMTAALMAVVLSSVAVVSAMTNAESDASPTVVSYSGGSANPYQPLSYPSVPGVYVPDPFSATMTSSKPILSKKALNRKIKQLNRTITSVHKRLMLAEDKIDKLVRTIDTISGDTTALEDSLSRLQKNRDQLESKLAQLNTDLASYRLQLQGAR
ncbi:MAG: hypothetical protein KBA40_01970 [Candidatus Peribacteraceae bacterium]|nr:hypothetical protein [Candidatus Peribacteraceae bacterium]MBP9850191.1 hypothetical protein [Candidatus Peribacteraceae bacterium]